MRMLILELKVTPLEFRINKANGKIQYCILKVTPLEFRMSTLGRLYPIGLPLKVTPLEFRIVLELELMACLKN